jgi:hypothetical protein
MRKFEKHWLIFNVFVSIFIILYLFNNLYGFSFNERDMPLTILYVAFGDLLLTNFALYFFCIKNGKSNFKFFALSVLFWGLAIFIFIIFFIAYALTIMSPY